MKPIKVNHGDVWGTGKDWFTFYCPNQKCKRQVSGEIKCPYCGQKINWKVPKQLKQANNG
jgi:DNA-directed RNA polymerase subunit RPC12/RpoP